jgi:hypothetical protein
VQGAVGREREGVGSRARARIRPGGLGFLAARRSEIKVGNFPTCDARRTEVPKVRGNPNRDIPNLRTTTPLWFTQGRNGYLVGIYPTIYSAERRKPITDSYVSAASTERTAILGVRTSARLLVPTFAIRIVHPQTTSQVEGGQDNGDNT